MVVELGPGSGVALRDPDDFTAFAVKVAAGDESAARAPLLAQIGVLADDGHVWIEADRVVSLAGERGEDPDWRARFARMVEYARTKDWVDSAGRIRAHVEGT
jgi:hypothetical protein